MKRASIKRFKNNRKFIINATNTMVEGGGIASDPYIFLDDDISYKELAKNVIEVLQQSKLNIERPKDLKESRKKYLKSMQVKTMKELHDESIDLGVLQRNGILKFTPTKNMGSRKGFQSSKSIEALEIPDDSSIEEIAKALEEALSRCEY